MIPLKLQLKNFLSYGPEIQTIEFSSYPLICLSGKNGHGKSALLDAITWALWGQARKTFGTVKADPGLVHLGQTQMLVILDFIFNEQKYRVRREFSKAYGKAVAALDFGMIDAQTNNFISLTDKTIKNTQEKIERMLNLDMESFVNSAFLRQGQANEFSKKSAKDRKTVLATILGLNRYESLRVLAHEKIKEAQSAQQTHQTLQEKRRLELEKKTEINEQLNKQEQELARITQQEQELNQKHTLVEQAQKEIAEKQKQQALLYYEQTHLDKKETELKDKLVSVIQIWKKTHKQLVNLPDKTVIETEKQNLIDKISKYQQELQKGLEIKTTLLSVKEDAQTRASKLKSAHAVIMQEKKLQIEQLILEHKHHEKQRKELTDALIADTKKIEELTQESAQLDKKISLHARTKQQSTKVEKQFEKRREYYQLFIAQGNEVKQKLNELNQKKKMVHDEHNPSCPLCEQNLSASRKRFLNETLYKSEQFLTKRFTRLSAIITKLKSILITQHEQITEIKKETALHERFVLQIEELHKQINTIEQSNTHKKKLTQESEIILSNKLEIITRYQHEYELLITTEENNIKQDAQLSELTQKIATLEQEYSTLAYNKEQHVQAQQALQTLEQTLATYTELAQAKPMQKERADTITSLCLALKASKKQKKALVHTLQAYAHLETDKNNNKEQENQLITQKKDLVTQKEKILQNKGSLENQQQKIAQIEQEFKEEQKKLILLATTIDDYYIIATATGKNGIQALLIEEAIPEIEQEANLLLSRLTNNQSHIIIESLRDLKNGGTKETLDIKISDSIGIRPYELFSGGEAFRIDFALRIAISKLLARRAGTSLQTLIIDEGFGSQDEDGLSNIMEAIYKIQDDFSKIIIVSHLSAMKDQFPVHFLVEKNAQGSHVRIMEQG